MKSFANSMTFSTTRLPKAQAQIWFPKYCFVKAIVRNFYIFHQKKTLKSYENTFYFTGKALFILEICNFFVLASFPFFPEFAISKVVGETDER